VAAEQGAEPSPEALRRFAAAALPSALVPSAYVALAELPLTPSGKIDRRALAAARPAAARGAPAGSTPARDPIEEAVAEIWAQLLGRPAIGTGDDFYALGGDSILAMRAVGQVRRTLGADVRLDEFLSAPTVAGVAERVRQGRGAADQRIEPATDAGPAPLSLGQEGLWRLDSVLPGNHAFTMTHAARYAGRLDPEALEQALVRCLRRHDVLRTTYPAPDGRPVQAVAAEVPACFESHRLAEGAEDEARQILRRAAVLPFDLAAGPVLRVALVSLGTEAHVLFVAMHHIAGDAWSLRLLLAELSAEYRGVREGRPPLPRPVLQYRDYARWQRAAVASAAFDGRLDRLERRLAPPLEPLRLPADGPRDAQPGFATATTTLRLGPEEAEDVRRFARRMGATVFMTVLTGLEALLHATTGACDLRVGTVSANRSAVTEDVVGLFLNTLVVRADACGDPTARELLARTRAAALDAYADHDVPFELVLRSARGDGPPLFEVMLVAESAPARYLDVPGVQARPLEGARDAEPAFTATTCDVVFVLRERPDGLDVVAKYKADLFRPDTVAAWLDRLGSILRGIVGDPDERLSRLAAVQARPTGGPTDALR
ncbi:MAG TPA: condensation domain-containing protein, partial [Solirubrobacteraceae bacterium]|nr:condensation domain-containing protein [Solirubrobacteraceae bacterium]